MLDEVIDNVVKLANSARTLGILYRSLIVPGFSFGNCPEICSKDGMMSFCVCFPGSTQPSAQNYKYNVAASENNFDMVPHMVRVLVSATGILY